MLLAPSGENVAHLRSTFHFEKSFRGESRFGEECWRGIHASRYAIDFQTTRNSEGIPMRTTHPVYVNLTLAAFCVTTLCGCPEDRPIEETVETGSQTESEKPAGEDDVAEKSISDQAGEAWDGTKNVAGAGWDFVAEKTSAGLTIVGEKVGEGKDKAIDASTAAWVWSKDKTTNGWKWVRENAEDATEWASDSATEMWAVTKKESGEFTLWVKVEVDEGVAWAKTTLPKAWKVTKDKAGKAWVWVGEHKVAMAVAATVVTIVVASLIASPEVVAAAAVKGAISGGSKASLVFLVAAWKNRDPKLNLKDATEKMFTSVGLSVLAQSGPQILSSMAGGDEVAG